MPQPLFFNKINYVPAIEVSMHRELWSFIFLFLILFFFNFGLKYIPLGYVGVLFYLVPTFHFITSIFILGETLVFTKLISFFIIWIAVGIFIIDVLRNEKNIIESNTQ